MSQPVKLSDELINEARLKANITHHSLASQISFWAALGRAIEPYLQGNQTYALLQAGENESVAESLSRVSTKEGRKLYEIYQKNKPYPHFETSAETPDLIIKIDKDGSRTKGRFIGRDFVAEKI